MKLFKRKGKQMKKFKFYSASFVNDEGDDVSETSVIYFKNIKKAKNFMKNSLIYDNKSGVSFKPIYCERVSKNQLRYKMLELETFVWQDENSKRTYSSIKW